MRLTLIEEQVLIREEKSVRYHNPSESCSEHRIPLRKSIPSGRFCRICKEETQRKDAYSMKDERSMVKELRTEIRKRVVFVPPTVLWQRFTTVTLAGI